MVFLLEHLGDNSEMGEDQYVIKVHEEIQGSQKGALDSQKYNEKMGTNIPRIVWTRDSRVAY